MKKWYNVELENTSARYLRTYLIENSIKYETSSAYNLIHFEIELDSKQAEQVDNYLEQI